MTTSEQSSQNFPLLQTTLKKIREKEFCNRKNCCCIVAAIIFASLIFIIIVLAVLLGKTEETPQNMTNNHMKNPEQNVNITEQDSGSFGIRNETTQNETYKFISNECNKTLPLPDHMKNWELNLNITGPDSATYINTDMRFDGKLNTSEKQAHHCSTYPCHIRRTGSKDGHNISVSIESRKTISCEWILKEIKKKND